MSQNSNLRGSSPAGMLPGYWDTTGNIFVECSVANPLPVTAVSSILSPVAPPSSSAVTTETLAISGTNPATPILAAEASAPQRRGAAIQNNGAENVWVGPVAATTTSATG